MHAALNLVNLAQVTHTAIRNGEWDDPQTWKDGKVPSQDARVHIPEGLTVTYGVENNVRHDTIRVDGILKFATAKSSKLLLDTMVVTMKGELVIGNEKNPIKSNQSVDIIFSSNTDISSQDDPMKLRRGLLSMGKVTVVGAEKLDHIKLKQPALKGDSTLVLDLPTGMSQPQGWNVGDRLVLGGTSYRYRGSDQDNTRFKDEVLEITKIDGNQISFKNLDITRGDNTVLRFDHTLPDVEESDQLNLYVANTSRNITFQSEDGKETELNRRGHLMFMQNPDVIVKNSGFIGLGRSDKSRLVDDPGQNVDGSNGNGTNPRGRYVLHLHRMSNNTLVGKPAIISGNAIVGSPGWGIVAHSSKANLSDNVVFDVLGSGIVAEGGDEQGRWNNNIVIKTTGVNLPHSGQDIEARDRLFDHGFRGEGYWIQGAAQVELTDNIAISANEAGLTIFGDTLDPLRNARDAQTIAVKDLPAHLRQVAQPGQEFVDINDVPLKKLDGLESYNSKIGFQIWGHMLNFDGEGEFNSPDVTTAHNLRSKISNLKVWGARARGLQVQYSTQIDFTDSIVIGNLEKPGGTGVFNNQATFQNNYDNLTVKGFKQGFKVPQNGAEGFKKDYLYSTLSNSKFSDNTYHLAKSRQAKQSPLADDFPPNFKLQGNEFSSATKNKKPFAKFSAKGVGGLTIAVNGKQSRDPDPIAGDNDGATAPVTASRGIVAYGWDFDNNGSIDATGREATYQYKTPGTKTIQLTVWDSQGATSTLSKEIQVEHINYKTPFLDGKFNQPQPYLMGTQANSRWSGKGWYATSGTTRDSSGFAVLSNPSRYSSTIGQVIQNNGVNQGQHTLKFSLKNIEGAIEKQYWRNNSIQVRIWGVNGQFDHNPWVIGPQQIGTLPMNATQLFSQTIGGPQQPRSGDNWQNLSYPVNLNQGYQFLLLQFDSKATRDQGDFVAIDNISLTGSPEPQKAIAPDETIVTPPAEVVVTPPAEVQDQTNTLQGDNKDNMINGSDSNDIVSAKAGNDTVSGGLGNDTIRGFAGNDSLNGNSGDDKVIGHAGSDILFGEIGNDTLSGGSNNDTLNGGDGKDILVGGKDHDRLVGGHHNDILNGTNNSNRGVGEQDTLDGGEGADRYILGNKQGSYYVDAQSSNVDGFATIVQLETADRIVLFGSDNQYTLKNMGNDTWIQYLDSGQPDLIGVIKNNTTMSLSSQQFIFR